MSHDDGPPRIGDDTRHTSRCESNLLLGDRTVDGGHVPICNHFRKVFCTIFDPEQPHLERHPIFFRTSALTFEELEDEIISLPNIPHYFAISIGSDDGWCPIDRVGPFPASGDLSVKVVRSLPPAAQPSSAAPGTSSWLRNWRPVWPFSEFHNPKRGVQRKLFLIQTLVTSYWSTALHPSGDKKMD
jgi:hypothetical protein